MAYVCQPFREVTLSVHRRASRAVTILPVEGYLRAGTGAAPLNSCRFRNHLTLVNSYAYIVGTAGIICSKLLKYVYLAVGYSMDNHDDHMG